MFFFGGFASVPILIRQDADFSVIRFEGFSAIIIGVILMVCGFGLALLPVWIFLF
jgi:hypothetical protein